MRYDEPNLVILGLHMRDATDKYRQLLVEEPERVMGKRVRIASCYSPRALDGLRVDDYVTTDSAARHRNYTDCVEILRRSQLKTKPREEALQQ